MSGFENNKGGTAGDYDSRPFSERKVDGIFLLQKSRTFQSKKSHAKGEIENEDYTERQCCKRI